MADQGFCKDFVSVLLEHDVDAVAELKTLDLKLIKSFKEVVHTGVQTDGNEQTMIHTLDDLSSRVSQSCLQLLRILGLRNQILERLQLSPWLSMLRKTALLLDVITVSYMSSHASRFDAEHAMHAFKTLKVFDQYSFAFSFSEKPLACLHAFLDNKKTWVVKFYDHDFDAQQLLSTYPQLSVLANIKELGDVWGPIWAIPSDEAGIKYYRVSKGVIFRVQNDLHSSFPDAVTCHYYGQSGYYWHRASSRLKKTDLCLHEDDRLLIGTKLEENAQCTYAMAEFASDMKHVLQPLGTKQSEWVNDSRSLAIGASKYLAITVTGTQKLAPATTLKQLILDRWALKPQRANPAILHQLLGVEVSHCTGNARRVPLKYILQTKAFSGILEQQCPGWTESEWGRSLVQAIQTTDEDAIFKTWKIYRDDRKSMADLVCTVLELLNGTGRRAGDTCSGALLWKGDEYSLSIDAKRNDWSIALRDTHLTASYVLFNDTCLSCDAFQHRVSTCFGDDAVGSLSYTVLQTHLDLSAATTPKSMISASGYRFGPTHEHLVRCGPVQDSMLAIQNCKANFLQWSALLYAHKISGELQMPWLADDDSIVFLRSSTKAYRGMEAAASKRWRRENEQRKNRDHQAESGPIHNSVALQGREASEATHGISIETALSWLLIGVRGFRRGGPDAGW